MSDERPHCFCGHLQPCDYHKPNAIESFRRALDDLLLAHGDWARTKWDHPTAEREALAKAATAAENAVMALFVSAVRSSHDEKRESKQ